MRIRKNRITHHFLLAAGLFTVILLLAGEVQTAGVLWVVIVCLLPPLMLALRTSYLSVKIFCATVFVTQIITVPVFYLQRDRYAFSFHRPFDFTALEALPVFLLLGLFLWLVAYSVKLGQRGVGAPVQWNDASPRAVTAGVSAILQPRGSALPAGAARRQTIFVVGILLLIAISLPVRFWMFDMGIGIVGTPPPRLPYRLSGVLTYLFGLIVPLAIGYLYIKTKRTSLLLALLISVYAVVIGLTAASKGVVLLTTAPIIAFAWLDKKWGILAFAAVFAGFGVTMASLSREIVHISDGLTTASFTELGTLGTLAETLARLEWSPEMLLVFVGIAGRVEGFQNLFLASQFNADAVGGAFAIFMHAINANWAILDHDALHLEFLGYTIPVGFYNAGASLNSWMLMAANQNLLMLFPFVSYAALTLVILEKMLMRALHKYNLPLPLAQAVLFFVILWFYTATGSLQFLTMFAVSVIFGLLPALRLVPSSRPRCSH